MPRVTKRRAPYQGGRDWKRKAVMKKAVFTPQSPVHRFQRGYTALLLTGNAVHVPYLNSFDVQLGYLPNFSEFTNLYDNYRIDYVQYKFFLTQELPTATTYANPVMHYCIDNDDVSIPTNIAEIQQHSNAKTVQLNNKQPFVIGFKPSVAQEIYRTGLTTAYASKRGMFLDCSATNVPHFGLKWALNDFANTNLRMVVEVRVWLSCRGAR